ncbi:hypothetical protein ACLVWU_17675 [Bdellovibrio sp. HCB290]|uniref:hypothetical protein n=1 Tax=Bdellovibrio sp. HCB290 TaxID=3394356 RepID=UPI0039B51821
MKTSSATEAIFFYLIPLVFLGSYLFTAVNEVKYGLNRDYAEGTTLAFIEKYRSSESPRKLYSEEAYEQGETIGYPVLHLALISKLSNNANEALASGRLISVMSALVIGILSWMILFQFGLKNLKFLPLIATLVLYQSAVFDWSLLARADLLAALFEVLGILLFFRSIKDTKRNYWGPFACFALAFLCKQNVIAGPLLLAVLELLKNRKAFLKSVPSIALGVAILGLVVTWLLGPNYWHHTITQLRGQPFYLSRLLELTSGYLAAHVFLFGLAFVGFRSSSNSTIRTFLLCWILIASALVLLGLGRSGSNFNYFISLSIPLALLAFLGIQSLLTTKLNTHRAASVVILLLFFAMTYAENHNLSGKFTYLNHRAWPPTRQDPEAALANTKNHLGETGASSVFCDEPGICTLLGYPANYMYFENQIGAGTNTSGTLKANYDALLFTEYPDKNLAWTQFKLPPGFLDVISENYHLQRITDLGFIFVRKK